MKLGRRIALDLNETQAVYMTRAAGVRRFAWNWALGRWHDDSKKAREESDPDKRKLLWPSTTINLHGADGAPELVWAEGVTRAEVRRAMRIVFEQKILLLARWEEVQG
jgi:hypothetical protein